MLVFGLKKCVLFSQNEGFYLGEMSQKNASSTERHYKVG